MSKANFKRLVSIIKDNPVFFNNSSKPQRPVEWQLLVTLCNLGFSGNASSGFIIGHMFGIAGKLATILFSIFSERVSLARVIWIARRNSPQLHKSMLGSDIRTRIRICLLA